MHNNYYFLRQLSKALDARLKGAVISECFSQNKEELVIRFETHGDPFFIKASLLSSFSCLSFPETFHRARKNSVDLFDTLIGQRLASVKQFDNERSFAFTFNDDLSLLFKMHGNRANVILFHKDEVHSLFKNSIQADATLNLNALDRPIDWSKDNFINNENRLKEIYFTFGKLVWQYLKAEGFDTKPSGEKWTIFQDTLQKLDKPSYYITETTNTLALSLLPYGMIIKEYTDPIKAVNEFYHTYTQTFAFTKEKSAALSELKAKLEHYQSYYENTFSKLVAVESDNNYKMWADIIMANLHHINPRSERVTLSNFYNDDKPVEIKLKKDLTPQKNAEVYYRKSKNQQIEINRLNEALTGKQKDIALVKQKIEAIVAATDLKSVRSTSSTLGLTPKEKQPTQLPYHAFEFNGYKIWVGRNAQSNDILTLKYTFKDDLWLHAKDVAGSHVVVKHQAGKTIPKDVIERAAQIAAYHSKRKNELLCPVIVTPKKYVRKRKGDPAGLVVVEREDVILVEPKKFE